MRLFRRIQYLFGRKRRQREIAEEIELHRALAEEEHRCNGLTSDDARHAVARRMGNATFALESAHSIWYPQWLEGLTQDLKHAARGLRRSPMLLVMVCLSLGLSTGFGTALFSVVNAVLLQPISAADPDSLVQFEMGSSNRLSWPNLQDLCGGESGLVCTGYSMEEVNWQRGTEPARIFAHVVSSNYFSALGISLAQGEFSDGDAAVVTHTFWERQLAADPNAIGRKVVLNGYPYTVVGVLPARFRSVYGLGVAPSMYLPAVSSVRAGKNAARGEGRYQMIGVLGRGETIAQFRSRLQVQANDLQKRFPADNVDFSRAVRVQSLSRYGTFLSSGDRLTGVMLLFGSLLMVLVLLLTVVACVNVAGLLIARAMARRQEISVRVSLGCGRRRLARLLLTESFLLSAAGIGVGAVLSVWLARMLVAVPLPFPIPFEVEVVLDWRLLLFLTLLALIATAVSGFAPILQAWRVGIGTRSSQGVRGGSHRWSLRGALIVGQVAVSTVLLITTGLFVRSLWAATEIHPGFDLHRVVTIETDTRSVQMTPEQVNTYQSLLLARLRDLPEVSGVSGAALIPLSLDTSVNSLLIDRGDKEQAARVNTNWILPGYFQVMGIPLRSGRDFAPSDKLDKPLAVIVNEAFVRQHFPAGDAIGHRVRRPAAKDQMLPWAEIVGVAADARYMTLGEEPTPQVYWPRGATADSRMKVLVRTESDVATLIHELPAVLRKVDARVTTRVQPLRAVMAIALFPSQVAAFLLSALGIVAWMLSIAGLYGVVSYSVSRRVSEVGLRMALGATPGSILRLLVSDGIVLTSVGVALGLALAAVATPALAAFLAGVAPHDAITFGLVTVALLITAIAASYWPARKGTRLAPSQALRTD